MAVKRPTWTALIFRSSTCSMFHLEQYKGGRILALRLDSGRPPRFAGVMQPSGQLWLQEGRNPRRRALALSWLGLLASGNDDSGPSDLAGARLAAEWMASIQHADGSMPVSPGIETPGWTTPLALLLWSGLSGFETPKRRARNRLLRTEGRAPPCAATIRCKAVRARRCGSRLALGPGHTFLGSTRLRWRSWRFAARAYRIIGGSRPGFT